MTDLQHGIKYLGATRVGNGVYRYYDDASTHYWINTGAEIRELGKRLRQSSTGSGSAYGDVYSRWCGDVGAIQMADL